ncbi:MAG: ABC transporter permease, partial [Bacteroidota bacterium]
QIKPSGSLRLGWRELRDYRELFYYFTWRDIKVRYKQTVLGAAWALLQPILLTVVFTLFFGKALGIDSGKIPYPLFVFPGMLMWGLFSNGINGASNSMLSASNIIKKIYFPRLILPISALLASLVDFIITFILLVILMTYYGLVERVPSLLIIAPISISITFMALIGAGCFFAALNVKYRDFRYVIPFFLQALFFLTPVIYPVRLLPEGWMQDLLSYHPVGISIDLLRDIISSDPIEWASVLKGLVVASIMLLIGVFYFRRTENYFADLA